VTLQLAREIGPDKTIATIFCDTGERYLSLAQHFNENTEL